MPKQQRRVFLKVLASCPLVACGGAPQESGPEAGGAGGSGSGTVTGGGSAGQSFNSGGTSSAAGSPFVSGGTSSGPTFVTGGRFGDVGGSSFQSGASSGGGSSGGAGGVSSSENPGMVVGNVSDFPPGSFGIAGGLFFIGHDAGGLFAMSMQCTHKGCVVIMAGEVLDCPCHQARFDRDGNVLRGPAVLPLPHFALYIDGAGNLSVDRFTIVTPSTRVAV